jgi:NADPH:quinone reductase-like Zn-dependent oxidoreductase
MRAVVQTRYGDTDVYRVADVPVPTPGPGQVLVRVRAASVHADVWHMMTGLPLLLRLMGGGFLRPKRPIPGTDMAGVVEAVGPGATQFAPGDSVFGETIHAMQWQNGGAYAELVAVDERALAPVPAHASFAEAACLPTSGYIAVDNLRRCRLVPGERLLINGAAGGVGAIALQLAKAAGAVVTAVDAAPKLDLPRALGADDVVDYQARDFTADAGAYDAVFDVVGNRRLADVRRALAPGGRYVLIGHDEYGAAGRNVLGSIPKFVRLLVLSRFSSQQLGVDFSPPPEPPIAVLARLFAEKKLTPIVGRAFPLEDAGAAMRCLIDGDVVGRIVLTP